MSSLLIVLIFIESIQSNRIEIDIPSIASPYTFELSSNSTSSLDRDVLLGLVDGTPASIPSVVLLRASYDHLYTQQPFNVYQINEKSINTTSIVREPIFRSYLLTSTFNRSYPFVRVLVASARGSYEDVPMLSMCAIVTAVNEQNLYETQACFISPKTGYCLTTLSVLKMVEYKYKNQTTNKIELYLKLHHVMSSDACTIDSNLNQDHLHHEIRIGHAEFIDQDPLAMSTLSRTPLAIEYPTGIHYSNWFIPLKLKLIVSSSLPSSFTIRCRLLSQSLTIHSIQNNVLNLLNHYIQIEHRQTSSDLDFHLLINQFQSKENFEIDLATILFTINPSPSQRMISLDWFFLNNQTNEMNEPFLRIPIQIQNDDIQTIVALTDYTRLINTAMLSMQTEQYPLKVLAINYSGTIQSISHAVCHSENVHLIQVDANCGHLYFSGHERDDFFDHVNSPTAIVIRYEKYLQRLHFTIYIPERPLRIELSDSKLSRINGWFVTSRDDHFGNDDDDNDDHDDDADGIVDDDDDDDHDEDDVKCYPVYQQSMVHVYTKFYRTTQNGDRIYLFNKLNVLVTHLVRNHLETDNSRVAIVKEGRVIGIGPGKTNVRIYSFTNKLPIGSKTIHVDDQETIRIETISFNLVTRLQLQTRLIEHIDPIYKVQIQLKSIYNHLNLDEKNPVVRLHVLLMYSDNTSLPLDEIPSEYYQLDVSINRAMPSLVHLEPSTSWKTIQLRPLAIGQTFLYGRLKLGQQQCTDDKTFSQNDLSCPIMILSNHTSSSMLKNPLTDQYMILNHAQHHHQQQQQTDHRFRTSPFLLLLSIALGACMVLFLAFLIHYFIYTRYRSKSNHHHHSQRRSRHATQSGAEEANQDWIFLDRNSLEMPIQTTSVTQTTLPPVPAIQPSPSIHNSTLHITSNPLVNTSTLQRQTGLTELSHSQMIAYFDNLKESHA